RAPAPDRLPRPHDADQARPARPRGVASEVDVVRHQPADQRARRRAARPGRTGCRLDLGVPAPSRPRQLDRGRHDRDPQERRRRARPRPPPPAMNFDLSDEQREIARAARELLAQRSSFARVREAAEGAGYDEALWAELASLGWTAIGIAEEDGGAGFGT